MNSKNAENSIINITLNDITSGDYNKPEEMFTSFSNRFHGCRKEQGFAELDRTYKTTPEMDLRLHKCIRPNIMIMAAKRRLEAIVQS